MIFTYLLQRTGNPTAPAFYILGAGILSVLATITIAETAGRPLAETKEAAGLHDRKRYAAWTLGIVEDGLAGDLRAGRVGAALAGVQVALPAREGA